MQVSASGSMSTVSKDDNLVLSSEDSSSPDESELELGLGLSLGSGVGVVAKARQQALRSQYARFLTAKDFPSVVSSASSSSLSSSSSSSSSSPSSSSSSSLSRANVTAGTKRSADSVAVANGASQVVGWPPIRAYRMNSLVNHTKSPSTGAFNSGDEENRCIGKADDGDGKKNGNSNDKGHLRSSLFVKVNMDGIAIGRKVDLTAHKSYEALARTLEDMFNEPTTLFKLRSSGKDGPSRLLDGSSEYVLTYEDKEGDWMLVGDVPWGMFLGSVKRLRIMRTSEANGFPPRLQERNGRQKC